MGAEILTSYTLNSSDVNPLGYPPLGCAWDCLMFYW